MDETKFKRQYVTPEFTFTALRLTDTIMTSPVEQYSDLILDGGDWDDWGDDGDSINDPIGS